MLRKRRRQRGEAVKAAGGDVEAQPVGAGGPPGAPGEAQMSLQ